MKFFVDIEYIAKSERSSQYCSFGDCNPDMENFLQDKSYLQNDIQVGTQWHMINEEMSSMERNNKLCLEWKFETRTSFKNCFLKQSQKQI